MFRKIQPLLPYLRRYRAQFAWGTLSILLANGAWILFPQIIERAVDDLNRGVTREKILYYALALVAVACFKGVFLFFTRWILIGISREIEFDLRNDLFSTLERQSPDYFQTHRTGDIMARMTNDLNAVRMLLGPAIMYSANTIVFTVGALFFMWHISHRLTLYAFLPLPLASLLIQSFGRKIHRKFERIQAMFSEISARAQENFSGARLVRAFAQEDYEAKVFEDANTEYINRSLPLARLTAMLWPALEFLLGLALVIALWTGGRQVVQHRITVGAFVAFNTYLMQLTWPMIALGWVVNLFQRGTASVMRIHELLIAQPTIDDAKADASLNDMRLRGDIEFRNLNLSYGNTRVLHDVNLRVPAGSSLAIVGPTGSGKTTLVSLLPRLHDATGGEVLLDGRDVRAYPLDTLRRNIGFVPQETFLFSESIAENIKLGAPEATEQDVEQAATAAHIAEDIRDFPRGFQTMVGERGITLSGGQKQRTAIARALIRDPRILVLDDALSSVDTYTEERILEDLRQRMLGRTTIFISHRVSTVRHADQIAVLMDGRVVELGRHEELIAKNGYYTSLWQKQQLEEELAVAG
jgi:ATP-binding cassette subfamily B multidrug efflux pump